VRHELTAATIRIARALFVALVTGSHERAMRPESEADRDGRRRPSACRPCSRCCARAAWLVRVRGDDGPSWELAHDSLVPRVLAVGRCRDLARRRATELVRYHLRRSRADAPSLLGSGELARARAPHVRDRRARREWRRRGTAEPWTPSRLVAQSRQRVRRQATALALLVAVAVAVPGYTAYRSHLASQRQEREAALRARNLGRFVLSLEPFDWDPEAQRAIPADPPLGLDWQLQAWTDDGPGSPYALHEDVERTAPRRDGAALVEDVETRGGRAYLTIRRRGCAPSLLPLKDLPGYAQRDRPVSTFHVRVPTCAATAAGTIEIPAGPFRYGGAGTPPSRVAAEIGPEKRIDLPRFWIDRTEVTNAAFCHAGRHGGDHRHRGPSYPNTPAMEHGGDPRKPVSGVNWYTARDYCRYLGKDLPTSEQWVKAMRGGERLPDGSENPIPDRTTRSGSAIRISSPR